MRMACGTRGKIVRTWNFIRFIKIYEGREDVSTKQDTEVNSNRKHMISESVLYSFAHLIGLDLFNNM